MLRDRRGDTGRRGIFCGAGGDRRGSAKEGFFCRLLASKQAEVFCYWKTRLPHPDQKKNVFVDDEMLMAFFERLAGENEQEKINFRFVLALVLMRKRRLKYDSSRSDGDREIWMLRASGDKKIFSVINPHLNEEQIQVLSSQIGQILQVDL